MTLAAGTTGKGLIEQVQKALGERSPAAQLVPLLYGNGFDGFDLPPARLAEDALAVLAFIAEKPEKTHKLRVRGVQGPDGSAEGSVVEILNDDMPFLVDSVMAELQARGLPVRFLLHPIFKTGRDQAGRLQALIGPGDRNWADGHQESYIAIHLQALPEAAQRDLAGAISDILGEVRAAVSDWQDMLEQLRAAIAEVEAAPRVPAGDRREAVAFLRWLEAGNFTFLGVRDLQARRHARDRQPCGRRKCGARRAARCQGAGAAPGHRAGRADARDPALLLRAGADDHH